METSHETFLKEILRDFSDMKADDLISKYMVGDLILKDREEIVVAMCTCLEKDRKDIYKLLILSDVPNNLKKIDWDAIGNVCFCKEDVESFNLTDEKFNIVDMYCDSKFNTNGVDTFDEDSKIYESNSNRFFKELLIDRTGNPIVNTISFVEESEFLINLLGRIKNIDNNVIESIFETINSIEINNNSVFLVDLLLDNNCLKRKTLEHSKTYQDYKPGSIVDYLFKKINYTELNNKMNDSKYESKKMKI